VATTPIPDGNQRVAANSTAFALMPLASAHTGNVALRHNDDASRRLADDVHQRVRLGILALLSGVTRADFNPVKTTLGATDGNLGQHLRVLEHAGLIATTKTGAGQRAKTLVRITRKGKTALNREIEALKEIVAMVEAPTRIPKSAAELGF
jgi:DNA-binding HxlR family transcriptional regulator